MGLGAICPNCFRRPGDYLIIIMIFSGVVIVPMTLRSACGLDGMHDAAELPSVEKRAVPTD